MILLCAKLVASSSPSSSSMSLTCVSVTGKLGNFGLSLIVATGLQNAVAAAAAAAATATTTSLLGC
jgi:hypothetical protein